MRDLGATNAMRVLGTRIGLMVYVADTLKGLIPVVSLPRGIDSARPELWAIAFGVAAIVGHVRPVFLKGQGGGKGVATAGGEFSLASHGFRLSSLFSASSRRSLSLVASAWALSRPRWFFHSHC